MISLKRLNPNDSVKPFDWFTENNKTGCRYITVDALANKVEFYEKYGFKILVTPQDNDETVLMYYDLKKFVSK